MAVAEGQQHRRADSTLKTNPLPNTEEPHTFMDERRNQLVTPTLWADWPLAGGDMNTLFTDTTTWALEHALSAVAARQRTASHNIANAATPGFQSKRVDFEESLASALRAGSTRAEITTRYANTPDGINGNDVSLEEESSELLRTGILYEALVTAENYKLGLFRTAMGGR